MRRFVILVLFSCAACRSEEESKLGRTLCIEGDPRYEFKYFAKRSTRQDEMGPFWANRGKKSPSFSKSQFFVEEPCWTVLGRNVEGLDPFYVTRGKKLVNLDKSRERRNEGKLYNGMSPFLAARGKKDAY